MNEGPQEVIAHREFDVPGGSTPAVLRIGRPEAHPDGDWVCAVQITGLGDDEVYEAAGVDSLQALTMALQMARVRLESHRRTQRIAWLSGDDLGL